MQPSNALFIAVILTATIGTIDVKAAEVTLGDDTVTAPSSAEKQNVDLFITTGARSMWGVNWGFIPMPPTAGIWVDMGMLRLRIDGGYHPFAGAGYGILGGGVVFSPTGKNAREMGGFQLKVPILLDAGFIKGSLEAGDGHRDKVTWMLLGPSSGADLVWWKAEKLAFVISFKVGLQFRIDIDSSYAEETYSVHNDILANLDTAILFGIAI